VVKRPEEYRWSSYSEYIGKRKEKARRLYQTFVKEGLTLGDNPNYRG
jgi:acyl-CoA-binding protein